MNALPKYLLIFFFSGALVFPWLNRQFQWVEDMENTEKRSLVEKPLFDIAKLDPYPEQFEAWYNDHFNLRNLLICLRNSLNYALFDETPPKSKILKGKDGWMFFKINVVEDYRNVFTISDHLLDSIVNELNIRNNWCRERGMELFTVIIPRKYTVYPEKLPMNYMKVQPKSNRERLMEKSAAFPDVNLIDLTPALLRAKKQGRIFHKLDMHWADFGAFVAYQTILKAVQQKVPLARPILPMDSFEFDVRLNFKTDFLEAFGLLQEPEEKQRFLIPRFKSAVTDGAKSNYPRIKGFSFNNDLEIVKVNPAVENPRAFIIRDSFTYNLSPFLVENFSHTTIIWDGWRYQRHWEKLEKEKPDVVICILQEVGLKALAGLEPELELEE